MRFLVPDPSPGVPLHAIPDYATRARAWISRISLDPELTADASVKFFGAVHIIEGMQYHHDKFNAHLAASAGYFNRLESALAPLSAPNAPSRGQVELPVPHNHESEHLSALDHEAVAYLNRLGQYFYFAKSLARDHEIPRTSQLVVFRHKHTAHRSIDAPRGEDEQLQRLQAMTFGFSRSWQNGAVHYQMVNNLGPESFCISRDHPTVMNESTELLLSLHPAR